MTDKDINFAGVVFYKPSHVDLPFMINTLQNSSATSVALIHKGTPLVINHDPSGTKTNPDVRYRSFWLGQTGWLSEDAEITAKNNGGILVTIDQEVDDIAIDFATTLITSHPELVKILGEARIAAALKMGAPPRVFVVHGHDETSLQGLVSTLSLIGADPVPFSRLPAGGSQTIVEILERGIHDVDAIVCLLTPDDEGRKRGTDEQLKPRARENVLIEAGYAVLRNREKSLLIAIGDVSIPSDFAGICLVSARVWDNQTAIRVVARLCQMGLNVDESKVLRLS